MMSSCLRVFWLVLCGALIASGAEERSWKDVQEKINAWHAEDPNSALPDAVLRMVYFHGNDRDPLADHEARLTRVMDDISLFYKDGMEQWGIESEGLPLERDTAGKLVLHPVRGQKPSGQYDYKSGDETEKEARAALAGKVDFDKEFVLMLYGQCWKLPDGRFGFYSPYYGKGGSCQKWGLCHAADCEHLDPQRLSDTKNRFKYWEHYGDRDQTVAEFNSFYLGGIAHELGHGLGLPHECQAPAETGRLGISLMGHGNLTYRRNIWLPGAPSSFLSESAAVRLMSHPLVTKRQRARSEDDETSFRDLKASYAAGAMTLSGKVESKIPNYAVIAYVDPDGRSDYDARTYLSRVEDGNFVLENMPIPKGEVVVRVTACRMNGGTTTFGASIERDDGIPSPEKLVRDLENGEFAYAEMAVAMKWKSAAERVDRLRTNLAPDDERLRKILLLEKWLSPEAPKLTDLSATPDEMCYLSDATWKEASSGWAGTPRDRWGADPRMRQGLFLNLAGKLQEKGLPAHCPAKHVFDLAGRWKRFQATVGIRDGAGSAGKAIFIVKADGKEIHRSDTLVEGTATKLDLDVSGVRELELVTDSGTASNHTCWAVWGMPLVKR